MINKLTKKEFLEELENSQRYFVGSGWMSLEEAEKLLTTIENGWDEESSIKSAIYRFNSIIVKPNRLCVNVDNGETTYRYFNGKNRYYKVNNFLVHIAKENEDYDKLVVMVNL